MLFFFAKRSSVSEKLDSCFPRAVQKLWISALINTFFLGVGVNFSTLDKNLICSSEISLEDRFTIFQERIIARKGSLRGLAGICEFHLG